MVAGPDGEELRRRLYRPGASPADLDAYLDAAPPPLESAPAAAAPSAEAPSAEAPPAEAPPPAAPSPARRRLAVAVVAVGALALVLGAAALAVGSVASRAAPAPTATPSVARWTAAPPAPDDVLAPSGITDGGTRPGARGTATSAGPGVEYTTGPDDAVPAVAARFGLCSADVLAALPYGFDPARLPARQHLLLQRTGTPPAQRGASTC